MVLVLDRSDPLSPEFAQVLERLEATFYQEVISKFTPDDFIAAGFTTSSVPIEELTVIAFDEQSHGIALGVSISFRTHILCLSLIASLCCRRSSLR